MSSLRFSIVHYVYQQLFTLQYFSECIEQHQIYHDGRVFGRIHENLQRYCLFQYRKLYPEGPIPPTYPLHITKRTVHIQFLIYLFWLLLVRSFVIVFVRPCVDTRAKRILLGAEMWADARIYVETTFLLWNIILYCFVKFTLTTGTLDYKFLAIFRMCHKPTHYLHYSSFGLGPLEYRWFSRFRTLCLLGYYSIMCTIPVLAPFVWVILFARESLFETNLISTLLWLYIIGLWGVHACATLYSNLIVFLVVAKYIQLKQKLIAAALKHSLSLLQLRGARFGFVLWKRFIDQNVRYSRLQEELHEYNRFWSSGLSFAFANYCSIIAYILYIVLFASASIYLKALYSVILYFHVVLFGIIIYYCGSLVLTNKQLSFDIHCQMVRFGYGANKPIFLQTLKLQGISEGLKQTRSGFTLLNDYLICYETFQLICTNIAIYFILVFNNKV